MKLLWSAPAIADRNSIYTLIEEDSPQAATLIDGRVLSAIEILKDFPMIGRPGRIDGTQELIIHRTPCVAAYRVDAESVGILRVLHGARIWPHHIR